MAAARAILPVILLALLGCAPAAKPPEVAKVPEAVSREPSYKWAISADGLTLRSGPGQTHGRISVLAHGTKLLILEIQEAVQKIGDVEGRWIRVSTEGAEGWVFGPFLGDSQPAANTGTITGRLSYPSDVLPAQTVIAFAEVGQKVYSTKTREGQKSYELSLPPGKYRIVSHLPKEGWGAGYTQAVVGGLTADQKDHSLIMVEVKAGATLAGIDPVDWYGGTYPPFPEK